LPPLALTAAAAGREAYLALGALEQASQAAEVAQYIVDVPGIGPPSNSPATGVCVSPDPQRLVIDQDMSRDLSAGDTLLADYFACNDSNGSISVELIEFDEDEPTFEAFVEFSVVYQQETMIEGSFNLVSTHNVPRDARNQTLRDITVDYDSPDAAAGLTHGYLERQFLPSNVPTTTHHRYRYAFSGRVLRPELGGEYRFITATELTGTNGTPPAAGDLVLRTSVASASFRPSADPYYGDFAADLYLDANGGGLYQFQAMIPWAVLSTGSLFNWEPNTPPRITRLSIEPAGATADDTLSAVYAAEDLDGDPLSYQFRWIVNGSYVGGPLSPTLSNVNFLKGYRVELEFRASDGEDTAIETVAITIANRPPINVGASISPPAPRSVDNLTLSWTAQDRDGDALFATYAWRVNEAVVPGATSSTLARQAYAKGDLVTGIARISDGTATVSAEASVTILDSPAFVSVPAPPSAPVDYDTDVSFTAVATDPDGDDVSGLSYVLTHGPAGMIVDPASGTVSWSAAVPLFEQSTEFQFGVTVNEPGASIASGSVTVTDPDREFPFMRMGLEHAFRDGFVTGDFDSDGSDELLVLAGDAVYELKAGPGGNGYRQSWAYLLGFAEADRIRSAATGDIDGDGYAEIFLAGEDAIIRLDGVHRRKADAATASVSTPFDCANLEFGDLNGDGLSELVCAGGGGIAIYNALTLDDLDVRFGPDFPIALANVDGDPQLEIVSGDGYVFDGLAALAGSPGSQWIYSEGFGATIAAGDLDGDGVDEIVAAKNSSSPVVFDAVARSVRATIGVPDAETVDVADLDGDGRAEILVGEASFPGGPVARVLVYRQDVAATSMSLVASANAVGDPVVVDAIAAGDFNGDGDPELLWSSVESGLVIAGFNAAIEVEWPASSEIVTRTYGPYLSGGLARDIVGPDALMFLSYHNTPSELSKPNLVSMDPVDGELRISPEVGQSGLGISFLLSDYDNDGTDEAILAAQNRIDIYDFRLESVELVLPLAGTKAIDTADLNGDGYPDLLRIDSAGLVQVYDAFHNTSLWTSAPYASGTRQEVAAADLDGDGVLEIVTTASDRLYVHSRTGDVSFAQTAGIVIEDLLDILVDDADGDEVAEIYAVTFGDSASTARVHRLNGGLQSVSSFDLDWPARQIAIENGPSGRRNLVAFEDGAGRFVVVDAVSGARVWHSPPLLGGVRSVGFVDVNGDATPEIAVATGSGMILTR
jgi:hypothetical protein